MISPKQYRDMYEGKRDLFIETRIDEAIQAHGAFKLGNMDEITIATRLFPSASNADLERVLVRYRLNGWECEIVSDSRDGDFIRLRVVS